MDGMRVLVVTGAGKVSSVVYRERVPSSVTGV